MRLWLILNEVERVYRRESNEVIHRSIEQQIEEIVPTVDAVHSDWFFNNFVK
jgi:hypothetical protein